ncbi:MAG: copper homeostasis protein CutC [Planctomycetota bacterium]
MTLEVCVDSLASARIAAEYGAARIELNSALELGGLTPSVGLVEQVVACLGPLRCQVIAMVRPRPGGFAYNGDELTVMQRDIDHLVNAGVDGIALGVLASDSSVDVSANRNLFKPIAAAGKDLVFHRAFDLTPDPIASLDCLIELGFTRVLTSGQAPTAMEGAAVIRRLIEHAQGRIEVLPGSGVTTANVATLLNATGCKQVHATLRQLLDDPSGSLRPAIQFSSLPPKNGAYSQADPDKIKAMVAALQSNQR